MVALFAAAEKTLLAIANMQATAQGVHMSRINKAEPQSRIDKLESQAERSGARSSLLTRLEAESSVRNTGSGQLSHFHWEPDAGVSKKGLREGFKPPLKLPSKGTPQVPPLKGKAKGFVSTFKGTRGA